MLKMYKDGLASIFENTLVKYTDIQVEDLKEHLIHTIERKKYDLQDQGIIEAILQDREKTFEDSFNENLELYLNNLDSKHDLVDYLRSDEAKYEIVEMFISDLEQLINYFYNMLINKHFT
jgi:hypothetical protein